jgi:mRNA-degrading endonuclease YafQ of YafQ-DinJ toxin-antitoxin module
VYGRQRFLVGLQSLSCCQQKISDDAFDTSLRTHKLKGDLEGIWSCSIDYDNRILFEFTSNPESGEEEILLLTLGSHDDVY